VKIGLAHIGVAKIGVHKIGAAEISALQVGLGQERSICVRILKVPVLEISPFDKRNVPAIPIFGPCRDVRPSKIGKGAIACETACNFDPLVGVNSVEI
jgi:hypothetical protein